MGISGTKLLAITGSTRKGSYNTSLLEAVRKRAAAEFEVELFLDLEKLPIFEPLEGDESLPGPVRDLIARLKAAAGVIICTPEYAHGIPGGLKNALDWLVDSAELVLKPVSVMSVSTSGLGGFRSHSALVHVLSAMNWNVVIESSISVPYAKTRFGQKGQLEDELTNRRIDISLRALQRAIDVLK